MAVSFWGLHSTHYNRRKLLGDVVKGRNDIQRNQIVKNADGGRGWAVACVSVRRSCPGTLSLRHDKCVTTLG